MNKVVDFGNYLEIFQYETNTETVTRGRKESKISVPKTDMGVFGAYTPERTKQIKEKRRDNSRRAKMAFKRVFYANLHESPPPAFLTLTYSECVKDPTIGYKDFRLFAKRLKYQTKADIRYICIPEFQDRTKRGAIHFHVILWGLSPELVTTERKTRFLAKIWGNGYIDIIQTDGSPKLASYMAKYMSKNFIDSRLFSHRSHLYSKNCVRPQIHKNAILAYYFHKYDLDEKNCLQDNSFMSKWLGGSRYRLFIKQK